MDQFTREIFQQTDGVIEVREIRNDGTTTKRWFDSVKDLLHYEPPEARNCYLGIATRANKRNGTKQNCLAVKCLWADFDGMTVEEVVDTIDEAEFPRPSLVVNSGHGVHCYWILDRAAGVEVEPVLKALAARLDSDPAVAQFAAVMRLPGSWNVKEPERVKPCELIKASGNEYELETFAKRLGVEYVWEPMADFAKCKHACIRQMSAGVSKGQRNFALGKITAYLKHIQGYDYGRALQVVKRWNQNNAPPKGTNELVSEFHTFWHGDWQYLGCMFSNERLEKSAREYCSPDSCQTHKIKGYRILDGEDVFAVDNQIFDPCVYPSIKPLTLAALSMLLLRPDKPTRRTELARLLKCSPTNPNFSATVKKLTSLGFVDVKPSARANESDLLVLRSKGNYGRGYTVINSLLSRLYIAKSINSNQYKLLVLLESYAFNENREVRPSNSTLAMHMGLNPVTVRDLLQELHKERYINNTVLDENGKLDPNHERTKGGKSVRYIQLNYERYKSKN